MYIDNYQHNSKYFKKMKAPLKEHPLLLEVKGMACDFFIETTAATRPMGRDKKIISYTLDFYRSDIEANRILSC